MQNKSQYHLISKCLKKLFRLVISNFYSSMWSMCRKDNILCILTTDYFFTEQEMENDIKKLAHFEYKKVVKAGMRRRKVAFYEREKECLRKRFLGYHFCLQSLIFIIFIEISFGIHLEILCMSLGLAFQGRNVICIITNNL